MYRASSTPNQHGRRSLLQRRAIPPQVCAQLGGDLSDSEIMTQNTSPICAKTTSGQKSTRGSLKTRGGRHSLQTETPSSWFGIEPDRRAKAKQPTAATNLWELLPRTWDELPEECLISIVERMPRVCSAVPSAKVGYFGEPKV